MVRWCPFVDLRFQAVYRLVRGFALRGLGCGLPCDSQASALDIHCVSYTPQDKNLAVQGKWGAKGPYIRFETSTWY